MDKLTVQTVVIGAGVVGLTVARELLLRGHEVILLEASDTIGSGISSRNSENVPVTQTKKRKTLRLVANLLCNRKIRAESPWRLSSMGYRHSNEVIRTVRRA